MSPRGLPPSGLVCTALADAWMAQGRLLAPHGGDTAELEGVRLMASGVAQPHLNGGDVSDPAAIDMAAVRRWYADRGVAAWGLRVPTALAGSWPWSRRVLTQQLMAVSPAGYAARSPGGSTLGAPDGVTPGLHLRAAGPSDLDEVVRIDAAAFEEPAWASRRWLGPLLATTAATVVLAHLDDQAAGTGYSLVTDGRAGPAAFVGGVGTVPGARRHGVATAVSRWTVEAAFARGAPFAFLHPTTEHAAGVYRRLGFTDVARVEIFVDC